MRKTAIGFVLVVLVFVGTPTVFAGQNCGNQSFQGAYGFLASGSITIPNTPITGPLARAGQLTGDGNGNVVIQTNASYNGNIFSEVFPGTYSVGSDCSIVIQTPPFAPVFIPATLSGFLSNNNRQGTFYISFPPGQTVHAQMTRQDAGSCSAASLSKTYTLLLEGHIITPVAGQLPGEFVRVGKVTFDGSGTFSAETTANYTGFAIQPENFAGTYSVAKDCTMSMQYSFGSVDFTWTGALSDNSKGAVLIVYNPGGSVINGTLQQQ